MNVLMPQIPYLPPKHFFHPYHLFHYSYFRGNCIPIPTQTQYLHSIPSTLKIMFNESHIPPFSYTLPFYYTFNLSFSNDSFHLPYKNAEVYLITRPLPTILRLLFFITKLSKKSIFTSCSHSLKTIHSSVLSSLPFFSLMQTPLKLFYKRCVCYQLTYLLHLTLHDHSFLKLLSLHLTFTENLLYDKNWIMNMRVMALKKFKIKWRKLL